MAAKVGLNFSSWLSEQKDTPKHIRIKKIDEGLLDKFLGSDNEDLARLCEEVRQSVGQLPSENQDRIMMLLEQKFGKAIVNAIDNGWTAQDFEKHKDLPVVQDLHKRAAELRQWVNENVLA